MGRFLKYRCRPVAPGRIDERRRTQFLGLADELISALRHSALNVSVTLDNGHGAGIPIGPSRANRRHRPSTRGTPAPLIASRCGNSYGGLPTFGRAPVLPCMRWKPPNAYPWKTRADYRPFLSGLSQSAQLPILDNASGDLIGFYIRLVGGVLALAARRCLHGRRPDLRRRAADDYARCAAPWSALELPSIPELLGLPDELRHPREYMSEFLQCL
jgi:hypothetical protein